MRAGDVLEVWMLSAAPDGPRCPYQLVHVRMLAQN
jgi:hypothetical protein